MRLPVPVGWGMAAQTWDCYTAAEVLAGWRSHVSRDRTMPNDHLPNATQESHAHARKRNENGTKAESPRPDCYTAAEVLAGWPNRFDCKIVKRGIVVVPSAFAPPSSART